MLGQYIQVSSLRKQKIEVTRHQTNLNTCLMTFISFFRFQIIDFCHSLTGHNGHLSYDVLYIHISSYHHKIDVCYDRLANPIWVRKIFSLYSER